MIQHASDTPHARSCLQAKDLKRSKSQAKLEAALRRREEQLKKIQDRMRKHMEKVREGAGAARTGAVISAMNAQHVAFASLYTRCMQSHVFCVLAVSHSGCCLF